MILSNKEKEALVISLAEQGKTTRQIAKELHISLKEIGRILRKARGEDYFEERATISSKCFQMFKNGNRPLDVSIKLNLDVDTTLDHFRDYLRLSDTGDCIQIYTEFKADFSLLLTLYKLLKKNGLASRRHITELIHEYNNVRLLRQESKEMTDYLIKMNQRRIALENEIGLKEQLISRINIHPALNPPSELLRLGFNV